MINLVLRCLACLSLPATFLIEVVGQTYNVWLNNTQIITDFKGTRSPEGYIGLQNHGNPVTFRKVLIEPLPVWATPLV